MTRNTRVLKITLDTSVKLPQISDFRKAVQEWVGATGSGVITSIGQEQYPLAQYRYAEGSGQILLLNEAADIFAVCLASRQWELKQDNTTIISPFKMGNMELYEVPYTTMKKKYTICNWVPLSQNNYKLYNCYNSNQQQQQQLLTDLMVRHIANYCHAVNYPISDDEIVVEIPKKMSSKPATVGNAKLLSFSGEFFTNTNLPKGIGLGRFAAIGWGIVRCR